MRAPSVLVLAVLAGLLLGAPCGGPHRIQIESPERVVEESSCPLRFHVVGPIEPGSLDVELNHVSILDRVGGGPVTFSATIEPGAPLRDDNLLQVRATRAGGKGKLVATLAFKYLPPGKARAHHIDDPEELIRGPLGHSRVGDWMLENGTARFAIQDAAQRELYSVGQYGGNLIDAELVGRPGMMVTDLKVVRARGERPSIGQIIARTVAFVISLLALGLGLSGPCSIGRACVSTTGSRARKSSASEAPLYLAFGIGIGIAVGIGMQTGDFRKAASDSDFDTDSDPGGAVSAQRDVRA